MKFGNITLALICLTFFNTPHVEGVDYILRTNKGVTHFRCVNSCGPVRVRKTGKCEFLVQSLYFNGKVTACNADVAALKACGEIEFERPINKELLNPACL